MQITCSMCACCLTRITNPPCVHSPAATRRWPSSWHKSQMSRACLPKFEIFWTGGWMHWREIIAAMSRWPLVALAGNIVRSTWWNNCRCCLANSGAPSNATAKWTHAKHCQGFAAFFLWVRAGPTSLSESSHTTPRRHLAVLHQRTPHGRHEDTSPCESEHV